MTALSLSQLNGLVRETLELQFDHTFWVVAEVSELRQAAGGHCYLELVEKTSDGRQMLARASAHIWRQTYALLSPHFERQTGLKLAAGLKVLVEVSIDFHEVYGYSLNVCDIDPTYTMGDMARRRQEILTQLEADGVLTMNKELPLPRLLRRIAVISAENAAGYGDFVQQLSESGLPFETRLFSAIMQGERVEASVCAALEQVALEMEQWDCVVIIRGGGATTDLLGFESLALANAVAQFPLPVLTGIGHERDDTVIDFVAHTRLKTPTAVAAFLISRRCNEIESVDNLAERLSNAVDTRLNSENAFIELCSRRLQMVSISFGANERPRLSHAETLLRLYALRNLEREAQALADIPVRLVKQSADILQTQQRALLMAQKSLTAASPERILRLGFSITRLGGRVVRSAASLSPGDMLTTQLQDGTISSQVINQST